ncbi:hypothetical protein CEXT_747881 [Caerostris extrusa]|uniref:Uncharacterized protein n=1 Tax=Caerostris extrusa TaxID=172846 RepID=A0AAV4TB94_CAEEX|nr:hypothetical protein CEXT_747881 [Caerostris extrusa]
MEFKGVTVKGCGRVLEDFRVEIGDATTGAGIASIDTMILFQESFRSGCAHSDEGGILLLKHFIIQRSTKPFSACKLLRCDLVSAWDPT